ncbi:hypothetical protein E5S69_10640 [Cupriavidus necator]|uniref:hypothetical protein n=1 Tax=Cupriavidus necator TaxID=106590 RepID=UPI00148F68E1|nr:hypothetical protein [Cupriavidus necator]NOV23973.1 hypothetical protein [Cupriavidus necator]
MKSVSVAAATLLITMTAVHAAQRHPDTFADGAHAGNELSSLAARSAPPGLLEEQFRTLAVRTADPYTDGAVRKTDPFGDGAARPAHPFTDGALASLGTADPFSDGA